MTDHLSPAARAVLDAFASAPINSRSGSRLAMAAALRAAADQACKQQIIRSDWVKQTWILEANLLAIADELEGAQ